MLFRICRQRLFYREIEQVSRLIVETTDGSYGLLPQRLDCVAALVPGILTYETAAEGIQYIAVDDGVLVKEGKQVLVSVRNAIGGVDLGKLHESVKKEFKNLDDSEKKIRTVMAKLESGFIYNLKKFQKE